MPKGGVSINLNTIISSGNYAVVPAGEIITAGVKLKVVKLLPLEESSDVVLTTLYIDEQNLLIRKSSITTRESGTYEMELQNRVRLGSARQYKEAIQGLIRNRSDARSIG